MYIKSPLNYIGGKYKLLDKIIPFFPQNNKCFVDLFAGGMNVGINVEADEIYINDRIDYLIELYKYFQDTPTNEIISSVKEKIEYYSLDQTNVNGYKRLRDDYNNNKNPLMLFVLICYSFNNHIRFNNSFNFNASFGRNRSSFNSSIEKNLIDFSTALKEKNIIFSNCDFREFDFSKIEKGSTVYCDPPYLITNGSYNDGKRGYGDWTQKEDHDLMCLLDELNNNGLYFALSNVFYHKNNVNEELIKWSKKYNITYFDKEYHNCNYNTKYKDTETVEVLITNYTKE